MALTRITDKQVTYKQGSTGSLVRNLGEKLREVVSVKDFGAVGDGVTDDTTAFQAALLRGGFIYIPSGDYSVSTITIPSNTILAGAGVTSNLIGIVNLTGDSLENSGLQSIKISGRLNVGGNTSTDRASDLTIQDVTVDTETTQAIYVTYVDYLDVRNLQVNLLGTSTGNTGVYLGSVYHSKLDNISIKGNVSLGLNSAGNSSLDLYALYDTVIDKVTITKNDTYTNDSGHHGVYLHGALNCKFSNFLVIGTWSTASTYGIKFRDSHQCVWENTRSDTMLVTSDAGAMTVNNTVDCIFKDTKADVTLYKTSGDVTNCSFINYTGYLISNSITGPVIFKGDVVLENDNSIFSKGCVFSDCRLTIALMDITTVRFVNEITINNSYLNQLLSVYNSSVHIRNSYVSGKLHHNSSGGSYTIDVSNAYFNGELYAYSYSTRVITGNISNTTFNADELATADSNPDVKKYRYVAFNNAVYDSLSV